MTVLVNELPNINAELTFVGGTAKFFLCVKTH